uniref:Uncharacterized protein n=1 Tax=Candidatus Kentrum sp. FM TaxID=2126340 RepID=A0A450SEB3_9GAMM|nr:MAG: hypothetical protein BECKFM1743C_GA0114222_100925 [Candidatus Kentron sp. FM]VFJ51047.1 MAG: hypothetical protein BECKFM1743A_GA0114220_100905 [Candidatus Kentron sp. FM]VFK08811.1 MAG: hypothetical protein BECKFM1743B_GA0114221_100825 [Candidatus Kentron sp. FM]
MQSARNFIRVIIEFSTSMQNGHNNFSSRFSFLLVYIHRNAPPIIANRNGLICVYNDINLGTKSR